MPRQFSRRYSRKGRSLARFRHQEATLALLPMEAQVEWAGFHSLGSELPTLVSFRRFRWYSLTNLTLGLPTLSRPSLELSARLLRDSPSPLVISTLIQSACRRPLIPIYSRLP